MEALQRGVRHRYRHQGWGRGHHPQQTLRGLCCLPAITNLLPAITHLLPALTHLLPTLTLPPTLLLLPTPFLPYHLLPSLLLPAQQLFFKPSPLLQTGLRSSGKNTLCWFWKVLYSLYKRLHPFLGWSSFWLFSHKLIFIFCLYWGWAEFIESEPIFSFSWEGDSLQESISIQELLKFVQCIQGIYLQISSSQQTYMGFFMTMTMKLK